MQLMSLLTKMIEFNLQLLVKVMVTSDLNQERRVLYKQEIKIMMFFFLNLTKPWTSDLASEEPRFQHSTNITTIYNYDFNAAQKRGTLLPGKTFLMKII